MNNFQQDQLPTAEECIQSLYQERQVLAEIDLNQANVQPHSWLWRQISPLYQPVFQQGQLILCTHQGPVQQDLISYLQKILALRDISNDFVLVVTDDLDIESKVTMAKCHSTDHIPVPYQLARFRSRMLQTDYLTDFNLPDTMCLAPWAKLEIAPDGTSRPCCAIAEPIKDDQGRAMTVNEHGIDKIYHSEFLRDLRSQLRRGIKPSVCQKCWNDESVKRKSIRQHIFWDLKNEQFDLDWDTESTQNIRSWHLALGNTCNLKCRVCDAHSSSKWAAEVLSTIDAARKKNNPVYRTLKQTSWAENMDLQIWNDIESSVGHIKELRFTGGEPLLIKKQFEVMHKTSCTQYAKEISLVYTTNGTVMFPEQYTDSLRAFRSVSLCLSIDDICQRFEYQRSGAAWMEVVENFRSYQQLKTHLQNFTLKINCTVSIMNVYYLPELIDWLNQHYYDFLRLDVLTKPNALSISNVTPSFQKAVLDRLESTNWPDHVQDQIDSICNSLRQAVLVDGNDFFQLMQAVDRRRQEDFTIAHPEAAALMNYQLQLT